MRTQDQERAEYAYEKVRSVPSDKQGKFKTLALKFPAMVLQCGLLQTLAFYQKQKESEAYKAITDWLIKKNIPPETSQASQASEDFLERVYRAEVANYRLAGQEALAYGSWLKRATEVLLKDVKLAD